jgi:hypothetical protein
MGGTVFDVCPVPQKKTRRILVLSRENMPPVFIIGDVDNDQRAANHQHLSQHPSNPYLHNSDKKALSNLVIQVLGILLYKSSFSATIIREICAPNNSGDTALSNENSFLKSCCARFLSFCSHSRGVCISASNNSNETGGAL